jgi:hypothetical protein
MSLAVHIDGAEFDILVFRGMQIVPVDGKYTPLVLELSGEGEYKV